MIKELLAKLTLEEKVSLVTGKDSWSTPAIPSIGLRSMMVSDGPSGVRGPVWDERHNSLSLPSATAIASTWDLAMLRQVGRVMAHEAASKGVHVVLGPTINLHRSPLGGRHFECFSEDPLLSGKLASAFTQGIQAEGVGATLKHFVANDSETERFTVDVIASEKVLRETYMRPFEIAVREANPWMVMSSYNSVNGTTMSENALLDQPLKGEWGYDGVAISDWGAVRDAIAAGNAATDLEMPGRPGAPFREHLADAVRNGEVSMEALDKKVERMLLLAERVGALGPIPAKKGALPKSETDEFARNLAIAGTVMLKNNGVLPLNLATNIVVIGGQALEGREQGGGSATVMPIEVITPLDGIKAVNGSAKVTYVEGVKADERLMPFTKKNSTHPVTGEAGFRVQVIGKDGTVLEDEARFASQLLFMDKPWLRENPTIHATIRFTAQKSGPHIIGLNANGVGKIFIDNALELEFNNLGVTNDPGDAIFNPLESTFTKDLIEGKTIEIRYEIEVDTNTLPSCVFYPGFKAPANSLEAERALAVEAAKSADVAIVFVGTTSFIESEGFDRKNLKLPNGHDELVSAVAKVAKKTIVVINAGSPVLLPWRDEVDAILMPYFPGQQMGNAIAQIIFGESEPGGRLPTTWAADEKDLPISNTTPIDGKLIYDDESGIGYRAWIAKGAKPMYPFGYGLGYTEWEQELVSIRTHGKSLKVEVAVYNTGLRDGSEVIQIYGREASSKGAKKLIGFAKVFLEAGEFENVTIEISPDNFMEWENSWVRKSGKWIIEIGKNALEVIESQEVDLA